MSFVAVYGKSFDSEDLSHERAFPNNKPTRRPHQKKQKTSPAPLDATMMHKEHTITTLNQVFTRNEFPVAGCLLNMIRDVKIPSRFVYLLTLLDKRIYVRITQN